MHYTFPYPLFNHLTLTTVMIKLLHVLLFVSFSVTLFAQDPGMRKLQTESLRTIAKPTPDTIPKKWLTGGVFSISAGQGSLVNWAAGGDDFSLSLTTSLNLFACYRYEKTNWDNAINLNFGYINTTSLGSRKNDDRIDFISKYGYALTSKLNLTTLTNFRSQMMKGYNYSENGKGFFTRRFASSFLSPAYVLISQGLDYKPGKGLSVFISPVTSRWIIVTNDSLAVRGDYGITPGKHSINQLGAFATINYSTSFNKHITYRGRVDLFSNYKNNPLNTDVYMTNAITAKVGKLICLNWNLDMIYDDDAKLFGKNGTSPALQLKSVVGIGLQVSI